MTDAIRTYPDDEIPLTDRHWRERWAAELTRATALEKELIQTRQARDAARKTNDMLTEHCEAQGRRIAALDALASCAETWMKRSQANFARADRLAEWIENEDLDSADLAAVIEIGGVECDVCHGKGLVESFEDVMNGSYHTTREFMVDCDGGCVNGRKLR